MAIINVPLSRYISRKIRSVWNLPVIAKELNLSVAKQENLQNRLIGLDDEERKLLLVKKQKDKLDCYVVDLQEVQYCSVKKVYSSIRAGDLKTKGLSHYLQSISLQLGFRNGAKPVTVSFYESKYNSTRQQSFLEAAAKKWQQFVSELLPKPAVGVQV